MLDEMLHTLGMWGRSLRLRKLRLLDHRHCVQILCGYWWTDLFRSLWGIQMRRDCGVLIDAGGIIVGTVVWG
jgi:hypothetical protein